MKTFALTPDDMEQVVNITKKKLESILADQRNMFSPILGSLELYKQENQRTKMVTFMADHKAKVVKLISGEALDSLDDYKKMEEIDERLRNYTYVNNEAEDANTTLGNVA